jgi:HNH endonuclease
MTNEYRVIPGFDRYRVSIEGEVIGVSGDALKQYTDKRGYKEVALYRGGGRGRKMMLVHRAVAMAWVAGDTSLTVNHKDGVKSNNRAQNLEWVSNADNLRHSFQSGIRSRESMGRKLGKSYAIAKDLLDKLFNEIRSGASIRATAIKHGVGVKTLQYQFKANGVQS